jgi:hypothetical protein
LGNVYQTAAHDIGIIFKNEVKAQNQQNMMGQAATTQGVKQVYKADTVADANFYCKNFKALNTSWNGY